MGRDAFKRIGRVISTAQTIFLPGGCTRGVPGGLTHACLPMPEKMSRNRPGHHHLGAALHVLKASGSTGATLYYLGAIFVFTSTLYYVVDFDKFPPHCYPYQ